MQTELIGLGLIGSPNVCVYIGVKAQQANETEKEAKRRQFNEAKIKLYNDGAEATKVFPL
jgi:hypothetical protein